MTIPKPGEFYPVQPGDRLKPVSPPVRFAQDLQPGDRVEIEDGVRVVKRVFLGEDGLSDLCLIHFEGGDSAAEKKDLPVPLIDWGTPSTPELVLMLTPRKPPWWRRLFGSWCRLVGHRYDGDWCRRCHAGNMPVLGFVQGPKIR